jgi:AcrR family transcriptional regulator
MSIMTTTLGPVQRKSKTRKPGRPRKVPPAEGGTLRDIKQEMLEATISLIAKQGYDGFVLRDVAEAVGVHTALVGYYFKSKHQLEIAALEHQIQQLEKIVEQLKTSEGMPAREALKTMFSNLAKMLNRGEVSHSFNRWTFVKGGEYASMLSERFSTPTVLLISSMFKKLMPEISNVEADARAVLFFRLADSAANMAWDQLQYLKVKSSQTELIQQYYRLAERQFLPELFTPASSKKVG